PVVDATVMGYYTYAVAAVDPDEDTPLIFTLLQPPPETSFNFSINANTGVLSGFLQQTGDVTVEIQVDDGYGGTDTQTYALHVHDQPPNQPPSITSNPVYSATVTELYQYQ